MFKTLDMMKKGDQRGFTLIELLIVVAIIAILAAVAIPQYAAYRLSAQKAGCASNVTSAGSMASAIWANTGAPSSATSGLAVVNIDAAGNLTITTQPCAAAITTCNYTAATGTFNCP